MTFLLGQLCRYLVFSWPVGWLVSQLVSSLDGEETYLLQLAQPLAWLGTAWRVIQQVPIHFVAHILFVTCFSHPYLVSCVVIHSFS